MPPDHRKRLYFKAETAAVRAALCRLFPAAASADDDSRAIAELVLAEVLNNVVEHAYAGGGGPISVSLRQGRGCLSVRVADAGRPYPAGGLPLAEPMPDPQRALCEGGFGWGLIRALATGIAYRRAGRWNVLVFRVPFNNGTAVA